MTSKSISRHLPEDDCCANCTYFTLLDGGSVRMGTLFHQPALREAKLRSNVLIAANCRRFPTLVRKEPHDWCGEFNRREDAVAPACQQAAQQDADA